MWSNLRGDLSGTGKTRSSPGLGSGTVTLGRAGLRAEERRSPENRGFAD